MEMEFPLRGADGRFRWFLTRIVPVEDAEGKVARWFGTNTDVTEQLHRVVARFLDPEDEVIVSQHGFVRFSQQAAMMGARIIEIPIPNYEGRSEIFKIHMSKMNIEPGINPMELAVKSENATGADIKSICMEAGMFTIRDNRDTVTVCDFERAIAKVLDTDTPKCTEAGVMFA